jgi:hypothetical protein
MADTLDRISSTAAAANGGPTPVDQPDDHLNRLLLPDMEEPWFKSFIRNIRETLNPPKLPPLEVTSKPVAVRDIWGNTGKARTRSRLMSLAIHAGVVTILFTLGTNETIQKVVKEQVTLIAPDIAPYMPQNKPKPVTMGGGGGGGDRSPLPPSKGRLPRPALKQFTLPWRW